jgi:predicted naringenin-chalcone synthase
MRIAGIGTAVPPHAIEQRKAAEVTCHLLGLQPDEAKRVRAVYRRSGVRRRHSVLLREDGTYDLYPVATGPGDTGPSTRARMEVYERHAGPLAAETAAAALANANAPAHSITHLVTVSCTGFAAPGVDVHLIGELGLPDSVERTHVGFMGCHGALNGIRAARAYADAGGRVLVVAVELSSLHYQYAYNHDNVVANALFADGAAAAVVDGGEGDWTVAGCGSRVFPDTRDYMTWRLGNHGFTLTLSPKVPTVIEENLREWADGFLERSGRKLSDVATFAVHPGGPRILDAVVNALGLPEDALAESRAVLAERGNMSSPTVLMILDRLRRSGAPLPCLALAFGPGLTVEAELLV